MDPIIPALAAIVPMASLTPCYNSEEGPLTISTLQMARGGLEGLSVLPAVL